MKPILYRLIKSIYFHGERLKILPHRYPRRIIQKGIDRCGISFNVSNITEANRVRFLDGEREILSDLLGELSEADILYDVGACIGLYALHASRRCQTVYAFEPDPGFRSHLKENIAINAISNVFVLPYAISDQSGRLFLYTDGADGKSPSLRNEGFASQIEVEARSLDDLVRNQEIPPATVVKIDIEGAEILALRGMQNLLRNHPPRMLFIEVHPLALAGFDSNQQEVQNLLFQAGYRLRKQRLREEQRHVIFDKPR